MNAAPPSRWREFPAALRALAKALARIPAPSAVIGGVAVIARGVPRFTEDIDATVAAAGLDLGGLVGSLRREKIVPRIADWSDLVQRAQVLLLVHQPTGIPIDLSLAWLPFEEDAIRAADTVAFAGTSVRVVRAEDLVIYKLIASRPQDLADAERLLLHHRGDMDLERVRRVLGQLSPHLDGADRGQSLETLLAALPVPEPSGTRPCPTRPAPKRRKPAPKRR